MKGQSTDPVNNSVLHHTILYHDTLFKEGRHPDVRKTINVLLGKSSENHIFSSVLTKFCRICLNIKQITQNLPKTLEHASFSDEFPSKFLMFGFLTFGVFPP